MNVSADTTVRETWIIITPDSSEQIFKASVSSGTLDAAMIQPKHWFQGLPKVVNTLESVGLQSVVQNYLICGCNVRVQFVGIVCLADTSD